MSEPTTTAAPPTIDDASHSKDAIEETCTAVGDDDDDDDVQFASKNEPRPPTRDGSRRERFSTNQKMVRMYQSKFKVPTMTSEELVARWKTIDRIEDDRDDRRDSEGETSARASLEDHGIGPLLLVDVRSKAERAVSMIQGALPMDDLETTRWINRYVHNTHNMKKGKATPTIVFYCTIGYRSGREAQWLMDDLTGTYGIEIGTSLEIKNLDGILSYSFVKDAPPLLRPCPRGSSDSFMTRRIHCYGKEWSAAADPDYDVVWFRSKPEKARHLLQTGLTSALRAVQHTLSRSTARAREATTTVAKTCVEPVLGPAAIAGSAPRASSRPNRISVNGYTSNDAIRYDRGVDGA